MSRARFLRVTVGSRRPDITGVRAGPATAAAGSWSFGLPEPLHPQALSLPRGSLWAPASPRLVMGPATWKEPASKLGKMGRGRPAAPSPQAPR